MLSDVNEFGEYRKLECDAGDETARDNARLAARIRDAVEGNKQRAVNAASAKAVRISASHKAVMVALKSFRAPLNDTSFAALETVAKKADVSVNTVKRARDNFVRRGLAIRIPMRLSGTYRSTFDLIVFTDSMAIGKMPVICDGRTTAELLSDDCDVWPISKRLEVTRAGLEEARTKLEKIALEIGLLPLKLSTTIGLLPLNLVSEETGKSSLRSDLPFKNSIAGFAGQGELAEAVEPNSEGGASGSHVKAGYRGEFEGSPEQASNAEPVDRPVKISAGRATKAKREAAQAEALAKVKLDAGWSAFCAVSPFPLVSGIGAAAELWLQLPEGYHLALMTAWRTKVADAKHFKRAASPAKFLREFIDGIAAGAVRPDAVAPLPATALPSKPAATEPTVKPFAKAADAERVYRAAPGNERADLRTAIKEQGFSLDFAALDAASRAARFGNLIEPTNSTNQTQH